MVYGIEEGNAQPNPFSSRSRAVNNQDPIFNQGRDVSPSRIMDSILDYDIDDNIDIISSQFRNQADPDHQRRNQGNPPNNNLGQDRNNYEVPSNMQNSFVQPQIRNRQRNRISNDLAYGVRGVRRIIRNPFNIGIGQRVGGPLNQQNDNENMNYEELLELQSRIGSVSKGYKENILKCIPIVYKVTEEGQDDSDCPICLEKIDSGTPQLSITCRHQFHMECLRKSLSLNKDCPVCKNPAIDLS